MHRLITPVIKQLSIVVPTFLTSVDVHPSSSKFARASPRTCTPSWWGGHRNSSACCPYRLRGTGTAPSVTTFRRHHRHRQSRVLELSPTGPVRPDLGIGSVGERTCRVCAAETIARDLSYFRCYNWIAKYWQPFVFRLFSQEIIYTQLVVGQWLH